MLTITQLAFDVGDQPLGGQVGEDGKGDGVGDRVGDGRKGKIGVFDQMGGGKAGGNERS